jgi:hypothetical protein
MITTDTNLTVADGWVAQTCTSAITILAVNNGEINVKLGSGGTSNGILLYPGDTLSAGETLYVKVKNVYKPTIPCTVTIAKD